jgi:hypothetical protein
MVAAVSFHSDDVSNGIIAGASLKPFDLPRKTDSAGQTITTGMAYAAATSMERKRDFASKNRLSIMRHQ